MESSAVLGTIICLAFSFLHHVGGSAVLMSPVVVPFGEWADWEDCPPGFLATSVDVRTHTKPQDLNPNMEDALGLVSIILECTNPNNPTSDPAFVFSRVGGVYNTIKNGSTTLASSGDADRVEVSVVYQYPLRTHCREIITGFQMITQPEQIAIDNTAANNIRVLCSELAPNSPAFAEGYGEYVGEWTESQSCATRQGVCGIQSQAEPVYKFDFDNTAINNIRLRCCELPNPALVCTPTESWELVEECNNQDADVPTKYSYMRLVGVTTSSHASDDASQRYLYDEHTGYSLDEPESAFLLQSGLAHNFREMVGGSDETGFNWGEAGDEVFKSLQGEVVEVEVPAGHRLKILQVVGKCSYFSVRTAIFKMVTV